MTTSIKTCFKCLKPKKISEFYPHRSMADGYLNKCKVCSRQDGRANRKRKIEYYREQDRQRGNRQDADYAREYRRRYPRKRQAHNMVNNAIRDGKLARQPCEVCGREDTHAHHDDYSKPMEIRWLCPPHHGEWHAENGEGRNP